MRPFRLAAFAMSVALVLPFGSSVVATTLNTPPSNADLNSRTLDLRTVSSQIVIETIEDALRQGGLALLGEGFQIDSSLSYVTEESHEGTIRGEVDLVIPFYNEGGHVIFTQPGFVFWEGLAEEKRVDGNLGIVYRTNLANTLIGIDAIGGASLFYDYDFHRFNHERLGIGVDMQTGSFQGAFNYYYPLSNEEDGREGFIEEALKGMDLRFALERDVVRAGARVGYWRYDGGEDVADEWRTSVGFEGGVRIAPGVFIEGEWEKHQEDVILDQRLILGLAFRFSLPDFEGQSYRDGSMSSDLYRIVEREKRVLYEERVAGPRVSIVRTGSEAVVEGGTIALGIQLSEELEENVTINLVGSGSAEYGSSNDYTLSVGGTDCTGVTEDDCQVSITAGQTTPGEDVVIAINDDGRTNEAAERIVISMVIASAGNTDLTARGSFVLTIPADPPLPTVSLSGDNTSLQEGDTATITLALSEALGSNATFNLIGSGGSADVTYGTSNDWNLSVGGTDCSMATRSNPCPVMISQGDTTAEVIVEANTDSTNEGDETFTVSVAVDSGSTDIVLPGSSSSLDFTIQHPGGTIGIPSSLVNRTLEEGMEVGLGLEVSDAGALAAILGNNIILTRTITITGDEESPPNAGNDITFDALEIDASLGNANAAVLGISVIDDAITEVEEVVTLTLADDNNVLPPGWSIDPDNNTITITIPANDQPLPTVSLSAPRTSIKEGLQSTLTLTLSEALKSDATFNLVNDDGDSATYGFQNDWYLTVNSTVCNSASGTGCQVTIAAGETSAEVDFEARLDTVNETTPENFTVAVVVDPGSTHLVQEGSRSSLPFTIPADPPLPTVSLSVPSTDVAEGDTATITLTLSRALPGDAMFHLVTSGDARYGLTDDWVFTGISCVSDSSRNACPVMISQGSTTATADILIVEDTVTETMETATVTVEVDSSNTNIVRVGSTPTLNFNIEATQHTVSFSSATGTAEEGGDNAIVNLVISPFPLAEMVEIPITITGTSSVNGVSFQSPVKNAAFQNGVITVNANEAGNIGFVVSAGEDDNADSETITVSLGTPLPPNFNAGTIDTWTVTTDDNEPSGTIGFPTSRTLITEDQDALPNIIAFVNISPNLSSASSVGVAFSGTASSSDYTISGGSYQAVTGETGIDGIMTLPADASRANLAIIRATHDTATEGNETIIITLSNRSGANALPPSHRIVQGTITITITDDD